MLKPSPTFYGTTSSDDLLPPLLLPPQAVAVAAAAAVPRAPINTCTVQMYTRKATDSVDGHRAVDCIGWRTCRTGRGHDFGSNLKAHPNCVLTPSLGLGTLWHHNRVPAVARCAGSRVSWHPGLRLSQAIFRPLYCARWEVISHHPYGTQKISILLPSFKLGESYLAINGHLTRCQSRRRHPAARCRKARRAPAPMRY